jgi:hypothetical protein
MVKKNIYIFLLHLGCLFELEQTVSVVLWFVSLTYNIFVSDLEPKLSGAASKQAKIKIKKARKDKWRQNKAKLLVSVYLKLQNFQLCYLGSFNT